MITQANQGRGQPSVLDNRKRPQALPDRAIRSCNPATQFKKGNAGKPVGASVISKRRARKIAKEVILAGAAVKQEPDFEGDALGYLQAVYTGAILGDPLRMNAAAVALKFERPALAATLQATVNVEMTPEQIDRRLAELVGRLPSLLTVENVAEAAVAVEAETQSE